jgi:hypothetical protein
MAGSVSDIHGATIFSTVAERLTQKSMVLVDINPTLKRVSAVFRI